jgi:hypothetical protein
MHRLLVPLLIMFFAGVQVFPVIGAAQAGAGHREQAVPAGHTTVHGTGHDVAQPLESAMSHYMKCCEQLGDTGSGEKASGCGADCASTLVEVDHHIGVDPAPREAVPLPAFTAPAVYLRDHPPKPV